MENYENCPALCVANDSCAQTSEVLTVKCFLWSPYGIGQTIIFSSCGFCKFQRLSRLGSVTAWQSSSEHQPNFAALNRRRHLRSAGRPSRWALAHILVRFRFSFCEFVWI